MTSALINTIVRDWMGTVMADPAAIRRKDPDRVLKEALIAALTNYSRRKGDCFDVAVGEFLDDDGDYYAVATTPRSTKHRKEITQWDAITRIAGGTVRRITKNSYEWKALRLALYPEMNLPVEDEEEVIDPFSQYPDR